MTPSAATWMDLDIIMLSGISYKKNKYITYMWNLKIMIQMNLFKKRNRFTDIENKLMVTEGESGEGAGID